MKSKKALAQSAAKIRANVIIDQTEAMTTLDINTGAFVGHRKS